VRILDDLGRCHRCADLMPCLRRSPLMSIASTVLIDLQPGRGSSITASNNFARCVSPQSASAAERRLTLPSPNAAAFSGQPGQQPLSQ
jgi:hypothetical protein